MDYSQIIKDFTESNFWNFMKFELIELTEGKAVIDLDMRSDLENVQGVFHGGAIMSLLDTSMGMAAISIGAEKVSTIQLEVRFIKPVLTGVITATSKIKHEQKSTCIVECQVRNADQELIALSTSTFKKN